MKKQLAKSLGISRPTLDRFMAMEGFPERTASGWNVEDCVTFVLNATEKDAVRATLDSGILELKKAELHERIRKLKIKNDQDERHVISIDEIRRTCTKANFSIKSRLIATEKTIPMKARMRLALTEEQTHKLTEILAEEHRAIMHSMARGEWVTDKCPHCEKVL
jgi:hypothetical protein